MGHRPQHHFGRETSRLPSPLVLLAAAARRTRRIALGTGVIVLPLETPLRVAEDAAVLDALADGRLQLGFGAGFEPDVFQAFGRDYDTRSAARREALAVLRRAFDGLPVLDARGEGADPPGSPDARAGVTLQPPAPTLASRLWLATGDAEAVAHDGDGLIVAATRADGAEGGPGAEEAARIARYRAAWRHAHAPRVALVRAVIPGDDRLAIDAALGPDILRYAARLAQAGGTAAPGPAEVAALLDRLGVLRGTPEAIAAALREDPAQAGATDLIVQVQTFGTRPDEARQRLETVAREIAPALGWVPAEARTPLAAHPSHAAP